MPRYGWTASALALALALALTLTACGSGSEPAKPAAQASGPRLVLATSDTVDWQDVSAEIATVDQAQVIARIPGILATLSVREGDSVRKGQVIGRIVDSQLGFQAEAVGAQAAQAQAELARVRFLYQNGVYAKARLEQAEAAATSARAQHAAAGALAGQGALVAPGAGRVLRADVPAGAPVAPGMAIAVITSGPVVARLTMPESLAGKVHPGSRVTVSDLGTATGTVTKVYPSVSAGQVTADVAMPGIGDSLIGRRIAARVETGTRKALLVPKAFITTRYGIDSVAVLGRDGGATLVPVQLATTSEPGKVEVLSGASAGDTLVGAGATATGAPRP